MASAMLQEIIRLMPLNIAHCLVLNDIAALCCVSKKIEIKEWKLWAKRGAEYFIYSAITKFTIDIPLNLYEQNRKKGEVLWFTQNGKLARDDTLYPVELGLITRDRMVNGVLTPKVSVFLRPAPQVDYQNYLEDIYFEVSFFPFDAQNRRWMFTSNSSMSAYSRFAHTGNCVFTFSNAQPDRGFVDWLKMETLEKKAKDGVARFEIVIFRPNTRFPAITERLYPSLVEKLNEKKRKFHEELAKFPRFITIENKEGGGLNIMDVDFEDEENV